MRLGKLTFFGQKQHIEAKILKIEQHLGMALCDQSFTVYRINISVSGGCDGFC